jgi:hypothetical protein
MRVCVCFLLAALLTAGCSSERPDSVVRTEAEVRSAVFDSLPRGWHQFDEGVQRRGPCHTIAYTLAASWRADRAGAHGWAADMPRDAIAIVVGLFGPIREEDKRNSDYPPVGELPLELPRRTVSVLEGYPSVPEYRAFGRTRDYLVEVRAVVNDPAPSRALLEKARSVVRRVRLPDWPRLC